MNEINYQLLQQVHQLKPVVRTKMIGVGTYLPDQIVTSDEIMKDIDTEKNYGCLLYTSPSPRDRG